MPSPMTNYDTIERLESRLTRLIEGTLVKKEGQVGFLIGLNCLDDILIKQQSGDPAIADIIDFMTRYRSWRDGNTLNTAQRKRLAEFLERLYHNLLDHDDADSLKLAEEVKDWLRTQGNGAFRLTLKAKKEEVSLADRFYSLLRREEQEIAMLLAEYDHLLTCLDDILKSADAKEDKMYRHLAASLIYYLQLEGYKVDPYIERLRRIKKET